MKQTSTQHSLHERQTPALPTPKQPLPGLRESLRGDNWPGLKKVMPAPASRMLVVEDDPDAQWRLARLLTVHGHRVVGTASGEGALALVGHWAVDIVVIDESLPGMTALQLTEKLQEQYPHITLVMMVDAPSTQHREEMQRLGALCVPKPIPTDVLLAIADAHLGKAGQHPSSAAERTLDIPPARLAVPSANITAAPPGKRQAVSVHSQSARSL